MLHNNSTKIKTKKLTLVQYYSLNFRPYSTLTCFSTNILFLFQDPIQNLILYLSCLLSLLQIHDNSLSFSDLDTFGEYWTVVSEKVPQSGYLFSHDCSEVIHHWEAYHRDICPSQGVKSGLLYADVCY